MNHLNNLGWTALLEAIVLGDRGQDHVTIVGLLLDAGADPAIPDGNSPAGSPPTPVTTPSSRSLTASADAGPHAPLVKNRRRGAAVR